MNSTPNKGLESFAAQHGLIHKGLILDKYHHFSHSRIRRRSTFETDYDFGDQVRPQKKRPKFLTSQKIGKMVTTAKSKKSSKT